MTSTIPQFPAPPATLPSVGPTHAETWLLREAIAASRVLLGSMASYRGSSTAPLSAALDNAMAHWRSVAEACERITGAPVRSPFERADH